MAYNLQRRPNETNFERYDRTMDCIYDKTVYETRDYLSLETLAARKLSVSWALIKEESLREILRQLIERQKTRLPCFT